MRKKFTTSAGYTVEYRNIDGLEMRQRHFSMWMKPRTLLALGRITQAEIDHLEKQVNEAPQDANFYVNNDDMGCFVRHLQKQITTNYN